MPTDNAAAAPRRLSRAQREALAMLRRSAEHPSTDTGLLTTGPSIYDAGVDVAWINTATAKALAQRDLIVWGEYVGPEEGGYVLHLTEAGRG